MVTPNNELNIEKLSENRFKSIINTIYYEDTKKLYELYRKVYSAYASYHNSEYTEKLIKEWKRFNNIRGKYNNLSVFFRCTNNTVANKLDLLCKNNHIEYNKYGEKFNINLFNIQELISINGVQTVDSSIFNNIDENNIDFTTRSTPLHERLVIGVKNANKNCKDNRNYYNILIIRHRYSFELYDILHKELLAYKNYKTGKIYKNWNSTIEKMCIIAYSSAINKLNKYKNTESNSSESKEEILKNTVSIFIKSSPYFRDKDKIIANLFANKMNELSIQDIKCIQQSLIYDKRDYIATPFEWLIDFIGISEEKLNRFIYNAALKNEDDEATYNDLYIKKAYNVIEIQQTQKKLERQKEQKIREEKSIKLKEQRVKLEQERRKNNVISKKVQDSIISNAKKYDAFNTKDLVLKEVTITLTKDIREQIYNCLLNHETDKLNKILLEIYKSNFIRLVERKEINIENCSRKSRRLCGITKIYNKNNGDKRDREYRMPVERGMLDNGTDIIFGGDNKNNQTQLKLSITDEAFYDMISLYNMHKPNQSELNGIIEDILNTKFNSNMPYIIDESAIATVLINRNKQNNKLSSSYKTIYIPCEYNAYIKRIIELSQQPSSGVTVPVKNNKSATLNAIVYEFLMYKTGHLYEL